VVVNGIQRTRPGATVKAIKQTQPTAALPPEQGAGTPAASKSAEKPQAQSGPPAGKKQ